MEGFLVSSPGPTHSPCGRLQHPGPPFDDCIGLTTPGWGYSWAFLWGGPNRKRVVDIDWIKIEVLPQGRVTGAIRLRHFSKFPLEVALVKGDTWLASAPVMGAGKFYTVQLASE